MGRPELGLGREGPGPSDVLGGDTSEWGREELRIQAEGLEGGDPAPPWVGHVDCEARAGLWLGLARGLGERVPRELAPAGE